MKKVFIFSLFVLFFVGCSKAPQKEQVALRIGDIEVTAREFDMAFEAAGTSVYGAAGKQRFLETFINRKLILKEAEKMGLHKDPDFLGNVQQFWSQSLLSLMLTRKSQQIATSLNIGDDVITEYYEKNKEKLYADKDLPSVYKQIKYMLLRQMQGQAIQEWVDSLEKNVVIDKNEELLGIVPPQQ